MPAFIDMTGRRFGQFVVLRRDPSDPAKWICRCDCGTEKGVAGTTLRNGASKRCGSGVHKRGRVIAPYDPEVVVKVTAIYLTGKTLDEVAEITGVGRHTAWRMLVSNGVERHKAIPRDKFGNFKTAELSSGELRRCWVNMHDRCSNPNNHAYHNYGGRGIRVCDRWQNFETFVSDVGERPSPDYSLDLKDNNGNYEPGNVRWATAKEQVNNRRPRNEWGKPCSSASL